ncbi:MAG: hypothetical protein NZ922_00200 [Candidatus Methanomethyliaceae archaeon]|nr:hypothetical protein [Candidatus Methanomethyliaceae archaeon]MDW7970504.1 Sjogren's syndrome/scleroderma autoantigen 1 family protein [Nitrososphaerota archaeon]
MSKIREDVIKRSAELLRLGATMLNEVCPDCKIPLFKLKGGEILCPSCNRKVIFVKTDEEEKELLEMLKASELEESISKKIDELKERMLTTNDPEEMDKIARTISSLIELKEKIRHKKI